MTTSIADWVDLMSDSVLIEPFVSIDGYGKPTYGAPSAPIAARVNFKTHMVRGPDGEERVSSGTIWLARNTAVNTRDRVTLSDGTQPPILASNLESDESGPLYVRLDMQ